MNTMEQPLTAKTTQSTQVSIAICGLAIICSLVFGVGFASHTVLRHLIQTSPLWIAVILSFRRSRAASWAGLPLFVFWLLLMGLIWAYLLGISHLLSGHFSPVEIAMTIIVGLMSLFGIFSFSRSKSSLGISLKAGLFVLMLAIQLICFYVSFLPAFARR